MQQKINSGTLYLLPSFLGYDLPDLLSVHSLKIMAQLENFVVEDARSARRFLRAAGYTRSFEQTEIFELDKHHPDQSLKPVLDWLIAGKNVGLISEAGCPAIADPGQWVVALCHQKQLRVVPLPGPSSILLTLMASGLNGQQFRFNGYLPQKPEMRKSALQQLSDRVLKTGETQLFIETPYRNAHLISEVLQTVAPEIMFCIAADITGPNEFISTKPIRQWKSAIPTLGKVPAVFALGRIV